ncbi:MAG: hypothetical protein FJ290_31880 [Planctomycetes bacterium]|nr:hypothetical protein [Planctomycetota bacterium]
MPRIHNAKEESPARRDRRMADAAGTPRFVCPYCHGGDFTGTVVEWVCERLCTKCFEKVKSLLLAGGSAHVVGFGGYCRKCERTVARLLGALRDLSLARA